MKQYLDLLEKIMAEGVKLHQFFGMMNSVQRIGADELRDG